VASYEHGFDVVVALLALVVALALQVGVNYANDYSDGVRGTDRDRVGPVRLVASGAAPAATVQTVALVCLGVGAVAGVVVVTLTASWWLLPVGIAAVLAAWYYTGGRRPYGYRGLGELSVFVFFGLVAVVGTAYLQTGSVTWLAVLSAVPIGLLASALLVVNNLRDIQTDTRSGKQTLAVRLGDRRTRVLYVFLVVTALALGVAIAVAWTEWALLTLLALVPAIPPVGLVANGVQGPPLVVALRDTGRTQLLFGLALAVALALG
jgi:1,4-dihydroxy-2-naphthoate octaprenyltransferase